MESKITIHPRYVETDRMGIVHHSNYAVWYELGRIDFCEQLKIPFHEIEARGLRQALVNLESTFVKPTVFGKSYTLHTFVTSVKKVKLTFGYTLYDENQAIVHRGTTLLAWLDEDLKPVNIAKVAPDIFNALTHALGQ